MAGSNRRQFLVQGAGAAAALLTPGLLGPGCADEPATPGATIRATVFRERSEIYAMGLQAAQGLGFTGRALAGAKVLIKPNHLVFGLEAFGTMFDPTSGEVTKAELVAAVAEQCLVAGAAQVTIAEGAQSRTWDWTLARFFDGNTIGGATNLKAAVDRLKTTYGDDHVALQCTAETDLWDRVPSASTAENLREGIAVARAWAQADHVISVPAIKTHQWALLTCALKNLFGLASASHHGNGTSRCKLHLGYSHATCHGVADAGVSGSFVDMQKWRLDQHKEDFAIVDGTIGLEGDGPLKPPTGAGRTIDLKQRNRAGRYFLLATNDLVAADAAVARLINIPRTQIKALQMFANLRMGSQENLVLQGATFEDLMVADWARPARMQSDDSFLSSCPT